MPLAPRHFSSRQTVVGLALLIGVLAGLVVGGVAGGLAPWGGGSDAGSASAAEVEPTGLPSPDLSNPAEAPASAPLQEGAVEPEESVGDLTTEVDLGQNHSRDGAVAAFSYYGVWLVGSPAAAAEPEQAAAVVGSELINPADARLLAGMQRQPGDSFDVSKGAYRIIGHAGDEAAPSQVMLEIAAPLTVAGKSRWSVVGGVVKWTASGWQLLSIQPREVPQPSSTKEDAASFSEQERSDTLAGLGWKLFATPDGR